MTNFVCRWLLPLFGLVMLSACSTTENTSGDNVQPFTDKEREALKALIADYPEYKTLLESWEEKEAGVERLLTIESELKLLIEQLNQLASQQSLSEASTPDQPEPSRVENAEREKPSPEATAAPENIAKQAPAEALSGRFGVQLAAMEQQQKLGVVWKKLVNAEPEIFQSLLPRYEQVTVSGNTLYRLKAGSFTQRDAADKLCWEIMQRSKSCMVIQYQGDEKRLLE